MERLTNQFEYSFAILALQNNLYLPKNDNKYWKFFFLILRFEFNFFNCSSANAAEISEGRKLYPKSSNIYLLSYLMPWIFFLNLFFKLSSSLKRAELLPHPLKSFAFRYFFLSLKQTIPPKPAPLTYIWKT